MNNFKFRIKSIQRIFKPGKIDAFLVSNIVNVRYLTGFTGSSGFLIITKEEAIFFTDFRYLEQAGAELEGFDVCLEKGKRINIIREFIRKMGVKRIGFETSVSYELYKLLDGLPVKLIPQKCLIENLRKIKDEEEIDAVKKAVKKAERAFLEVKHKIKAGVKEREIALRLEDELKKTGCRRVPFDIIVASGKNSSMPHARPTEKRIEKGDFVIIDWGGEGNGYYSDMTRTFLISGRDLSEKIKMYNAVNTARRMAIESVRRGVKTSEVDMIARNEIKKAGYGEFFGHGTGHGIGLDVHEYPRVSWIKGESISDGMVFTVEPGVYIPGIGGVRIEDMVAVKQGRGILLTGLSRELEIIK